ncbi:fimbrial protein [Pseudomonas chlororaphis]
MPNTITYGSSGKPLYRGGSNYWVTLVKTGEITAGTQSFNGLQLSTMSVTGVGTIDKLLLNGSITTSQCTLPAASKQIEVSMGSVEKRKFNGKGTTSETVPFNIPLNDCEPGSYRTDQPWNFFQTSNANIRLDGINGSAPVSDTDIKGALTLNNNSTAKGVAVQILDVLNNKEVDFGKDTPILRLQKGTTHLLFKARYIQTSDSPLGPEPGIANATANFTLTYK